MSNVLSEHTRQQVLALGRLGWSLRRIEEATGVRRETASGYLKAAGVPVRGRGGRPRDWPPNPATTPEVSTDPAPPKPATSGEVSTDAGVRVAPGRAPQASACEPYRELIVDAVRRGRNAMAIWQDLVDDHGFSGRYASVRRYVAKLRSQPAVEARVVITTAPGEEAQVDYGEGPMVCHPDTGKYRRTRLFVLTLGYSRKGVRLLVLMNLQLHHVLTDVTGVTGVAILRDIVAGETDSAVLARHRDPRCKATEAEIAAALTGHYRAEHLFVLRQALEGYDFYQTQIGRCDDEIQCQIRALEATCQTPDEPPDPPRPARRRSANEPRFEIRAPL